MIPNHYSRLIQRLDDLEDEVKYESLDLARLVLCGLQEIEPNKIRCYSSFYGGVQAEFQTNSWMVEIFFDWPNLSAEATPKDEAEDRYFAIKTVSLEQLESIVIQLDEWIKSLN